MAYLEWIFDKDIQRYIEIARDIGEDLPRDVLPPLVPKWQMECIEFYHLVSTQWRTSFGGVVGLDYTAVIETAKVYEFELDSPKMEIIRTIEEFIKKRSNHER